MYNYMYFQPSKVRVNRSINYEAYNQVDSKSFKLYQNNPKIPSMTELFQESGNDLPLLEETELQSKFVWHNYILQLKDKLFFIKYTPQITLQAQWYIFQVDLASTSESNPNAE